MDVHMIESDRHYREAWGKGIVRYMSKGDRMRVDGVQEGYEALANHVRSLEKGCGTDCILWLLEEAFMYEQLEDELIGEYLKASTKIFLLSESVYGYPDENREDDTVRIDKFQSVDLFYKKLKHYYMEIMGLKRVESQGKEATVHTHFFPIWTKDIMKILSQGSAPMSSKRLLLLMDGYSYRQNMAQQMGLTEVFYYFHKDYKQLDWVIHEAAYQDSSSLDIICGPKHMEDFDYLKEEEMTQFIRYIKESMNYDTVDIVVNGLAITSRINSIFNETDRCTLYVKDETIQQTVLEQTTCTWQINERG